MDKITLHTNFHLLQDIEYVFEISIKEKVMNTLLFFLGDIIVGGQVIWVAEASVDMMQIQFACIILSAACQGWNIIHA